MATGSLPTNTRRVDAACIDVVCCGTPRRILIKRMAHARRFTLRIRSAKQEVVLTLPQNASLSRARLFAERHADWIGARLGRLPAATGFRHGATVLIRGLDHRIEHRPDSRGTVWVECASEEPLLCVTGDVPFVARRVKDFLIQLARRDLAEAVSRHASTLGVRIKRITLRDTTSRWGSCSSTGALNFSWRLIMAPPHVLDYLAAHEVAHLVEMNHSAAFWDVVARLLPNYEHAEAWLKTNGVRLMRLGLDVEGP